MEDWIRGLMTYPGIVFLMALENIFPPIPSELIMPLAGYRAGRGELNLWLAIACGTLGALIGQIALFWLGKKIGEERLTEWADKHGEWLALKGEDIKKAEDWFDKHGEKAAFFGRMVPGVRSLVSIPAGLANMEFKKFVLFSALGSGLWTAGLAAIGYFLGEQYEQASNWIGWIAKIVLGGMFLYFIYKVVQRKRERAQEKEEKKNQDESASSEHSGRTARQQG